MKMNVCVVLVLCLTSFVYAGFDTTPAALNSPSVAPEIDPEKIDPDILRLLQKQFPDEISDEDIIAQQPDIYAPLEDFSTLDDSVRINKFHHMYSWYFQKFDGEWFKEAEMYRIRKLGRYVARDLVFLKNLTDSQNPEHRQLAYNLLALVSGNKADGVMDFLIGQLNEPQKVKDAESAAKALARTARTVQSIRVINDALKRLQSDDPRQRQLAIVCLGALQDVQAVEPLMDQLDAQGSDLHQRLWIYQALSEIKSPQPTEELVQRQMEIQNPLEAIVIEDTIFRITGGKQLGHLARNMGRLEQLLRDLEVGPMTQKGQQVVIKSMEDMIDEIIDEMSRQQPEPGKRPPRKPRRSTGQKSGSSQEDGESAQDKGRTPGGADGNEPGSGDSFGPNGPGKLPKWGFLPQQERDVLNDLWKDPNLPWKYRRFLYRYFKRMSELSLKK